jgi:CheY-like chemotaxis protein
VMFLDIGLPVMDGYEVARQLLKARHGQLPLRLIALTGYGQRKIGNGRCPRVSTIICSSPSPSRHSTRSLDRSGMVATSRRRAAPTSHGLSRTRPQRSGSVTHVAPLAGALDCLLFALRCRL